MRKAIKGNIVYTEIKEEFIVYDDSYLVYEEDIIEGIYEELPTDISSDNVIDYGSAIIIPSFIDLHIHAPQYIQIGLGLNLGLIDWLNKYTFKLEKRFSDVSYGKRVYPHFVESLYEHGSLRSCIFATNHDASTRVLMEELKKKKLSAYVGIVNMDQNAPEDLLVDAEKSIKITKEFIEDYQNNTKIKPIITPRFVPSCTKKLMDALGKLSMDYHLPVQTHLAETKPEVKWVKSLFPDAKNYSDVYVRADLYGHEKTIMAHGIYLEEEEIELAKEKNTYLVHCPNSNMNLSSGIMELTNLLDRGLVVGLGSDVGAGHEMGMNKTMSAAIQCSKIRHIINDEERILLESEAFYLATNVNGSFFGNTGTFKSGYKMDVLVIKDDDPLMDTLTPLEQLQRFIYCGGPDSIVARYLEGEFI